VSSIDADVNITVVSTAGKHRRRRDVANGDTTDLTANTVVLTAFRADRRGERAEQHRRRGRRDERPVRPAVDYSLSGRSPPNCST